MSPDLNASVESLTEATGIERHPTGDVGSVLSAAAFIAPKQVDLMTEVPWMEHGPFAFWLIDVMRPGLFVELGTHTGFSYFSFCQAVKETLQPTKCFAIDTWKGDEHAGFYGEEVFTRVNETNTELYSGFSQLIRAQFSEALPSFLDGEIDLLHIDGRHRYEDVREDFENWRPKLSVRGVVLFHDTNVRSGDFGVWKFWRELTKIYPSFEFLHGHGLGVVAVGEDVPQALRCLFKASPEEVTKYRQVYSRLGAAVTLQRAVLDLRAALDVRLGDQTELTEGSATSPEQDWAEARQRLAQAEMERDHASGAWSRAEAGVARAEAERDAALSDLSRALDELRAAETVASSARAERCEALADASRVGGKLLRLELIEQRAIRAEADREKAFTALSAVRLELDSIRYSTFWRATQPLRRLLGGAAAKPARRILRRVARGAYWCATLQFPRRFAEWRAAGRGGFAALAASDDQGPLDPVSPAAWYSRFRQDADYKAVRWRGRVRFSILMPVYRVRAEWLAEAISSVINQTYPHWELICIDDASRSAAISGVLSRAKAQDSRVRDVELPHNEGVSRATNAGLKRATGDYVLLMDHDDVLEPHALARLGDAAFMEDSDILYGDEVVTGERIDDIIGVQSRPVFSHTYYLSHPYFVHPVAVRTRIAREIGGLAEAVKISQDIDFMLRAFEVAEKVTHVPDILYRWRTSAGSTGHLRKAEVMAASCAIKTAHMRRIGFDHAEVTNGTSFNTFTVNYFGSPAGRVLAVIPTKNQGRLLRQCVDSVRRTTTGIDLDLVIVDHESDDQETLNYLGRLEASGTARILRYEGRFNYSAINNHAISACGAEYDFFLFLNNDIEAIKSGWLDHMVDVATRSDVGVVGATLLYPDHTIQHSGVIVGMHDAAEHAFKTLPFRFDDPGYGASLHATREYSAVTAACMLVPREAFAAVIGFDEALQVGFNDTDLCLRIGQRGYRVVNCAEAVLIHHESATRGREPGGNAHPKDSALFMFRYKDVIRGGDQHYSPLLARDNPTMILNYSARFSPSVENLTVSEFLPKGRRMQSTEPRTDKAVGLAHAADA